MTDNQRVLKITYHDGLDAYLIAVSDDKSLNVQAKYHEFPNLLIHLMEKSATDIFSFPQEHEVSEMPFYQRKIVEGVLKLIRDKQELKLSKKSLETELEGWHE